MYVDLEVTHGIPIMFNKDNCIRAGQVEPQSSDMCCQ
jgi:hypothetical protein